MKLITLVRIENDETLSLVQFEPGEQPDAALRAACRIDASDEGLSITLPDGLRPSRQVLLDLPASWLRRRVLTVPISDPVKLREVLPMEAEGRFQESPEELVLDFLPLALVDGDEAAAGRIVLLAAQKERLRALLSALEQAGLDPRVVTCLDLVALSENRADVDALLDPAALDDDARLARAAAESRTARLNFRRGDLRYTAHQREAVRLLRFTVPLLIVLIALLGANWALRYSALTSRIDAARAEEASTFQKVFPKGSKLVNVAYQIRARTRELETKLAVLSGVDPLTEISRISNAADSVGEIELSEARMDEGTVVLKGSGDAFATVNRFADTLKSSYASVEISDTATGAEGGVRFTIVLKGARDAS